MPHIDQFRSFCLISELQSFSKASDQCNFSQQALSHQIKKLEIEYGSELFHRKGGVILLTENGKKVYNSALEIISLFEKSIVEIKNKNNFYYGDMKLGASSGFEEYPLPLLLGLFGSVYSNVKISLRTGDSREIVDQVYKGFLDLGFVGNEISRSNLSFKPFFKDEMILIVDPNHPFAKRNFISIEEFIKIPLILQQRGEGIRETLLALINNQGINCSDLNVLMEMGLQNSVKSSVMFGFGAAVASKLSCLSELSMGKLVEVKVEGLELKRPIYLCTNNLKPLSNIAKVFIDFVDKKKENLI